MVKKQKLTVADLKFTEVQNLLLNMSSGLLPEHLNKREIGLLVKKFGNDWFSELGYKEPDYKRPK